jgi:hypothetical protein
MNVIAFCASWSPQDDRLGASGAKLHADFGLSFFFLHFYKSRGPFIAELQGAEIPSTKGIPAMWRATAALIIKSDITSL